MEVISTYGASGLHSRIHRDPQLRRPVTSIILGILQHLTLHHDESLVQVWIIDWERQVLPGIAAAPPAAKFVKEEDGVYDAEDEARESEHKNFRQHVWPNFKVEPDPPAHIADNR